jgi:hypothetical protein
MQFRDRDTNTVAVFSHPNHEVAVYGLLQRLRPRLIFLTDGGGEERVRQTKEGLERLGLGDRALFVNHSESSFYDALLNKDIKFFKSIATLLESLMKSMKPDQILCDAVEFYNPVHDIALPLVMSAVGIGGPVFEVPLVYQKSNEDKEEYAVQRAPVEWSKEQTLFHLSKEELAAKMQVFDGNYEILKDVVLNGLRCAPKEISESEAVIRSRNPAREPEPSVALRYEWRAKKLLLEGKVQRIITRNGNYLPLVNSLLGLA